MINKKLIYISNTRLPSEKANTYQSMVMCEAFSKFCEVEFWYPIRRNTPEMSKVNSVFEFYNVKPIFKLKKIYSMDLRILHNYNQKIWFLLQNSSFSINYLIQLILEKESSIIFTRDMIGLYFLSYAKKLGILKNRVYFEAHIFSKKIAKLVKNVNGLVVINNYLKKLYEEKGIKNILVAHDGVKLEEYNNINYKSPSDKIKNVVYIGNLFEWKGVYTLAESMKYMDNNVRLLIVGGSDDTLPKFREYIEKNNINNIDLIGFVSKKDTLKYIEIADVLVLPNSSKDKMSYYTSPLKLFEYMASKRVIVASRLPSIKEVLEDKKNAILFEPDNPKDLADKIKWCLENDTTTIVKQAYKDVQEYTWDKRAGKIINWILK